MTDKEFRKLKRGDLLELLLAENRENTELSRALEESRQEKQSLLKEISGLKQQTEQRDAEIKNLWKKLEEKEADLAELQREFEELKSARHINISEAGSIAEASLLLSGIFEAAQRAADIYLTNVRLLGSRKAPEEDGE